MADVAHLTGLEVIAVQDGRRLGAVSECVVQLSSGRVLGIVLRTPGGEDRAVARDSIMALGPDVVTIRSAECLSAPEDIEGLPECRPSAAAAPLLVITDGGRRLGVLGGVYLDDTRARVAAFEVDMGAWEGLADGEAVLPLCEGIVHGRDAVVVPESAVATIQRKGGVGSRVVAGASTALSAARAAGSAIGAWVGRLRRAPTPQASVSPADEAVSPGRRVPIQ